MSGAQLVDDMADGLFGCLPFFLMLLLVAALAVEMIGQERASVRRWCIDMLEYKRTAADTARFLYRDPDCRFILDEAPHP